MPDTFGFEVVGPISRGLRLRGEIGADEEPTDDDLLSVFQRIDTRDAVGKSREELLAAVERYAGGVEPEDVWNDAPDG